MSQTAQLQAMIDSACEPGGSRIVDLGDRLWVVHKLILAPRHDGIEIRNGQLYTTSDIARPDKRYGIVELLKGIHYRGVTYPDRKLRCRFVNVDFIGPAADWTDDVFLNQSRARTQGWYTAGINAMNGSRPDEIETVNCTFRGLFAGVQSMGCYRTKVRGSGFYNIAGHGVVASVPADNQREMTVDIHRVVSSDCGSVFDFSAPNETAGIAPPVVPSARVDNVYAKDTLGRTKVHGVWDVTVQHSSFRQSRPIPNRFAGLNFPQARSIVLDDVRIEGFPAGGVNCSDWIIRPDLMVRNCHVLGGQIGINSTAMTTVQDSTIDSYVPWGDSTRPQKTQNVKVAGNVALATIAAEFAGLRRIVGDWNTLHRTNYDLEKFWFLLPEVRAAMAQMEAGD